ARAPEQAEELALVDVERNVVDGGEIAELLGDVANADEWLGARIAPGAGVGGDGRLLGHPLLGKARGGALAAPPPEDRVRYLASTLEDALPGFGQDFVVVGRVSLEREAFGLHVRRRIDAGVVLDL